ncbi:hypothetical protein D3C84_734030 [compost metagenome]
MAAKDQQVDAQALRLLQNHLGRIALAHPHRLDQCQFRFFAQLVTKVFQNSLLDIGHDVVDPLAVQLVQRLLVQIALQQRLGELPHGLDGVDHIKLRIERARQCQRVLQDKRRVDTEVSGIQHGTDHSTSSTAAWAEQASA